MFKKFCASVLATLLIFGGGYAGQDVISAVSMTAQAENTTVWDGSYDTSWYDEEETELHISTAAEFAGIRRLVNNGKNMKNQTIYLDKDIVLNDISDYKNWGEKAPANTWSTIGTEKIQFAGTFDAQNHTITGMYTSYGLFNYSTGTIQNVKLASAYANYAAVCYHNSGTIDNCHIDAVVYSSSDNAGGVCCSNSGTIQNCTMAGSVESIKNNAGGICYCNSRTVTNCKNTASVTGNNNGDYTAGGIVAYTNTNTNISNCQNTGDITGYYAGGILGYAYAYSSLVTISDSYNTGTVTGTNTAGGILGYSKESGKISNCYNIGTITGEYAGGILGCNTVAELTIDNCHNEGNVGTKENSYAGGILGYGQASETINNSYNTGTVQSDCAGGILGYTTSSSTIRASYNAGEVTGTTNAGGILGYAYTSSSLKVTISDSYNAGEVTGTTNAGGILGYAYTSSSLKVTISDSYNTGTVTGKSYAGGILGYGYAHVVNDSSSSIDETISNVYNVGKLSGTQTGGIIGKNEKSETRAKITTTLTACYYLNTTATKGIGNATTDNAISKSESGMKKESFAQSLGEKFIYVKDNYPKLAWEKVEQPTEGPTEQPTEQPTEEPTKQPTEKPTQKPTEEPTEPLTEQPTQKPTEEPTEPPTEQPAETKQPVIKFTEYSQTATLSSNYDGDIVWLSSDTKVATVENGVVTAVGIGKATIYAICGDQRVETPIEVSYNYYLKPTNLNLTSGTQTQLEFHSANNKEIYNQLAKWSSSNEKVAKVDNEGIITAISAGKAVITAKAGDVSVTCEITVTDSVEPAIFAQSTTIKEGEKKAITISNYNGSVTWVSSDTKVVTIDTDGTLTGVKAGTAVIYAMLDNGKTVSQKITVVSSDILLGDVTLDGEVDILDVITINKAVLGKETLTAEQIKAADINKNDVPDSTDALMILKYIVKIIDSLN